MLRQRFVASSLAFVLAVACFATAAFSADTIVLKGAKPAKRGTISSVGRTAVVIKTGLKKDKPTSVPANEIDHIEWDGAPATLNSVRAAEAKGDYAAAVTGYEKFLKSGELKSDNVKADVQFFIARAKAKQALGDPKLVAAAIDGLQQFSKSHAASYHYYELLSLLGDLQLANKNFKEASDTFSELGKAPWKDVQLLARCAEARVLVAQNKPQQALPIYETVLAQVTADPLMKPLKNQAALGKAACLQQTSKNDESLGVLRGVIAGATPADTELLAEAYTLQGDSYQALGRSKEALLAYLHVDVLFAKEKKYHPKSLYYLSQLWAKAGKPLRAGDARSRLKTEYPNSEWAKK